MSETKLLIHVLWSTKNQKKCLNKEILDQILFHIIETAKSNSIQIYELNGCADHLHALIRLHSTQSLAQVIHNIKGEVSNWINTQKLTKEVFEWQEGYNAVSISPSCKAMLKKYFRKHELKHVTLSYLQEVRLLKRDLLFPNTT